MIKSYDVFSVHKAPAQVTVQLPNGTPAQALVDSLAVQLIPEDRASGTLKLVYTDPTEIAAAEALYTVGAKITAAFTAA
jgi:hypothetical protein